MPLTGLRVSLLDQPLPEARQLIHRWLPKAGDEVSRLPANPLIHDQEFELARSLWTVQVEAGPAWMKANAANSIAAIPLVGVLLTLLLLICPRKLSWMLCQCRKPSSPALLPQGEGCKPPLPAGEGWGEG
ncbi:hypothetical protein [Propionivibrio sp.]|uniref:hypothetical protein n=1 Tax=Propionivibrio sp. TaxID=2212460 RepID=UPI003BF0F13E